MTGSHSQPTAVIAMEKRIKTSFLRFDGARHRQPRIDEWLAARPPELRAIAQKWFAVMRECGNDVTELLHDGHPTACVEDGAFGYVNVFTSHVNIGFFHGATLEDPTGMLEGDGRFMRHVKARPSSLPDEAALKALIGAAYLDIKKKLAAERRDSMRCQPVFIGECNEVPDVL